VARKKEEELEFVETPLEGISVWAQQMNTRNAQADVSVRAPLDGCFQVRVHCATKKGELVCLVIDVLPSVDMIGRVVLGSREP